ncbi:MAG: alpha/beta hydrolase [Candidatus Nanopelagicaceae bacterium]|jgi:pimeloyl-ACP methyl ester carboxylesterase|nr:alpha/beta hydrolase [Candidatus Nanopelagicaceae bacterium]
MTTPWVVGPLPDQTISYGDAIDQVIEFYNGTGPLVTLIHGGYWRPTHNREHMRALAAKLAENGFRVANIEYRRDPGSPEKLFQDVDAALSSLNGSIALIGFSVGGQLALIGKSDAHKLILLAPITDLQRTKSENLGEGAVEIFFGDCELKQFDPMQKNYDQHLYIIHGDADDRVPLEHSRDFARAKGASLMEVTGADHFAMVDPDGLAFSLILQTLLSK